MNTSEFWKNFRLGEELHIAGSFIYNALRRYHELQQLEYSDDVFEFLYNLSVGLERILKIAIVLHEHTEVSDQALLEKSLITHSHIELAARLRKYSDPKLSARENDLLQLLSTFYKTLRYDRFSLNSVFQGRKENSAITAFLGKYLAIQFSNDQTPFGTPNTDRYRAFMRRTIHKISRSIYQIIEEQSSTLGLYAYELRRGSKAESVFLREIDIGEEDILWKELLVFFMNAQPTTGYFQFLKGFEPLQFDPALSGDYLNCFKSDAAKAEVMDELESHYADLDPTERTERLARLALIGAQGVYFDDDDSGSGIVRS